MFSALFGALFNQTTLVLVALLAVVYFLLDYNYKFFERKGIPYVKPWPLLGSMVPVFMKKMTFKDFYLKSYNLFKDSRLYGQFEFTTPVYIIRDPDLMKQLGVKEFESFMDHRLDVSDEVEPYFSRNLFAMKEHKWKLMRSILTPAFTGSKMRLMFGLIRDCAQRTIDYLTEEDKKGGSMEFEMKEFFTRVANDSIATAAFGLEVDSFKDKNSEFFRMAQKFNRFSGLDNMKFLAYMAIPRVANFLKLKFMKAGPTDYFKNIILETIKYRDENKVIRPDMIQLLMHARDKGEIVLDDKDQDDDPDLKFTAPESFEWTETDLVAQCLVFFLAGFETTSTLFSFMSYELAINPDIQQRLQDEIDQIRFELDGKPITYEHITSMKYMEMVIQETLRVWPPVPLTDRRCRKECIIEDSNGHKIQINPGENVMFSFIGYFNDSKYFPNPEKFDPERYSEERRKEHPTNVDMGITSFGLGPRLCIGNRFAIMEAKCIFFYLLSHFNFERCDRTQIPLLLEKNQFPPKAEKGIWIKLKARK